jgi:hypothetical protein
LFAKIRKDIGKSRWIFAACVNYTGSKFDTGVNNTGGKFATSTAGVFDTGGKFATCVNDTGGSRLILFPLFAPGVNDNGNNISLPTP